LRLHRTHLIVFLAARMPSGSRGHGDSQVLEHGASFRTIMIPCNLHPGL